MLSANKAAVCLVDDDQAARESLAFLLGAAGHVVRAYESAVDCLKDIGKAPCACLITDVRMPEIDGIEFLERLNRRQLTVPTIVITGDSDVSLAIKAMRAGAVAFIVKPYNDEEIVGAVRAACAQPDDAADQKRRLELIGTFASVTLLEQKIIDGVMAGKASAVIASELGLAPRVLHAAHAALMAKLQAHSLSDMVRIAVMAEKAGLATWRGL